MAAESELYSEVNAAWAAATSRGSGQRARVLEMLSYEDGQALAGLGLLGQKDGPLHTHVAVVCHGRFNKILLSSLLGRGHRQVRRDPAGQLRINVVDVDVAAAVDAAQPATEVALDSRDHLNGVDADTPLRPFL